MIFLDDKPSQFLLKQFENVVFYRPEILLNFKPANIPKLISLL